VRIIAISGSLDAASSNTALLREVAARAPDGIDIWAELGELPHFRPDDEGDAHVMSLRRAISSADVVLIATPEYAGGMPGSLKNALDWLVGSGELYGKPVVVTSAAPALERGANARRWVADVAGMQGATVVDSFTVAVRRGSPAALADAADAVLAHLADLQV
jgi:chromate reductase, NAD(P)H dehydrogenase (quinone)